MYQNLLKRVSWKAVADGLFVKYTSTQHYVNDTEENFEINYSFPLPFGKSVLTGFSVTINGQTRTAKAFPKQKAVEKYEDAIESGDSPVMLEIVDKDFCTASLGNLQPGEKAEIVVEYLLMLSFTGNNARLTIPTVLDARYASSNRNIPFGPHEIKTNIIADYDCTGELLLKGNLAHASVSSPTHSLKFSSSAEGLSVSLNGKAKLDRDIVFDIELSTHSSYFVSPYKDHWIVGTNFRSEQSEEKTPLDLAILIDCSGSMDNRINAAKECLVEFTETLTKKDTVSYFCFGSTTHCAVSPQLMDTQRSLRTLQHAIEHTHADLGGTEMGAAFDAVTQTVKKSGALLLITDGEVWDTESILRKAKATGRTVFVIGIGMAPYHNLLQKIAEETGGVYDSVYPRFDVAGAIARISKRIRNSRISNIQIQWPTTPLWVSDLPVNLFKGDSLTVFAELPERPEGPIDVRLLSDGDTETIKAEQQGCPFPEELVKLAAHIRMIQSSDNSEKEKIALEHNLAGSMTNLLLVYERVAQDKATKLPSLTVIPQMVVEDRMVLGNVTSYCMSPGFKRRDSYSLADCLDDSDISPSQIDFSDEPHVLYSPETLSPDRAPRGTILDLFDEYEVEERIVHSGPEIVVAFFKHLAQKISEQTGPNGTSYKDNPDAFMQNLQANWPDLYNFLQEFADENSMTLEEVFELIFSSPNETLEKVLKQFKKTKTKKRKNS